jgi:hypothetical protein
MAAKIINLGNLRKQKSRQNKQQQAEENRIKFGRSKNQKLADKRAQEQKNSFVDGHKLDD